MPKNLLLFYPSNKRTIAMETLIFALKDSGVNISVLTTSPKGDFHSELEKNDISTFSLNTTSVRKGIIGLIRFCKAHHIDTVHAHLQFANLIAVFAQFFIKAKVIVFRHHFEMPIAGIERNKNELLGEKIINKLAKKIVVPSSGVYNGMKNHESVDMKKVEITPYIYDFSKYQQPNIEKVHEIRAQYKCKLLLLICARHVVAKRHKLVFDTFNHLINKNLDIQLLVMDDGPERAILEQYTKENQLSSKIHFLGFKKDFINYFSASELLLHPSVIDASNSVVKEMALLGKTALVCEGIGDFSDYFDKENGFLMNPQHDFIAWADTIEKIYADKAILEPMGLKLKETVLKKFSATKENLDLYLKLV